MTFILLGYYLTKVERETTNLNTDREIEIKSIENKSLATLALIESDYSMEYSEKSTISYFLKFNLKNSPMLASWVA